MNETCIPNISAEERRKRLRSGAVMLVVNLVVLAVLMAFGVSRWWRLALFPLFAGAASGYFQWRDET
jgi:fatty acid desaturase